MPSIPQAATRSLRRKKPRAVSLNQIMLTLMGLACLMVALATISSGIKSGSVATTATSQHSSPLAEALQTSQTAATIKPLNVPDFSSLKENEVPSEKGVTIKKFPGAKAVVAYAISITSCASNATTVFDGPAILSHSIHQVSIRHNATLSQYDYKLYAFVHPDATHCTNFLEFLGYEVLIRDLPFNLDDIQSKNYKSLIEQDGCCGSREFLKLWAFALTDHDIVVHTDTDVFFLKPLDTLFDAMLDPDGASKHSLATMGNVPLPSTIDFVYTRDYLQRSRMTRNPKRFGVQGGFFVAKPSKERMDEMVKTILKGDYERGTGWAKMQYGGYWGSPQIQGFLSYFYGEIRPEHAVELNRCLYNTMVDDPPEADGRCRTGEETCEDCRETPLENMINVHLTTCWKPWNCPTLKNPHPPRCKEVHRAWFDRRQSLERSWGYEVPTDGWWFPRTLGYCTKKGGVKKRYYVPLKLPNSTRIVS